MASSDNIMASNDDTGPYEKDFFRCFVLKLAEKLRIPQFYRMPKVHKQKNTNTTTTSNKSMW